MVEKVHYSQGSYSLRLRLGGSGGSVGFSGFLVSFLVSPIRLLLRVSLGLTCYAGFFQFGVMFLFQCLLRRRRRRRYCPFLSLRLGCSVTERFGLLEIVLVRINMMKVSSMMLATLVCPMAVDGLVVFIVEMGSNMAFFLFDVSSLVIKMAIQGRSMIMRKATGGNTTHTTFALTAPSPFFFMSSLTTFLW